MALPTDIQEAHRMIEELRKENADRRVKAKAYEEAFADFSDQEKQYLLSLVQTTAVDPDRGARGFRDLAYQMLKKDPEAFLDGLDIELPQAAPAADESTDTEDEEEEATVAGLTAEQLQKVLDEREAKAAEAREKEAQEAEIEAIFAEIEAVGFERGSEGFMTILSLAQSQAAVGKDVDFAQLAPKVAEIVGVELPTAEEEDASNEDAIPDAKEIPDAPEGSGKPFASTADIGGVAGAPTEKVDKDWAKTAIKEGRDPMEVARERAERRLAGDLVD